ncbi:MAG: helix-turn-helix domain-containing protein [Lachnospiraceae bacterium]
MYETNNDIDFKAIGSKLREIRTSKGLTQEYVATIANVNVSHISNIENNRVKISLQTLVFICNALNVTVDFVLSKEYFHPTTALDNEILKELHSCDFKTKEQVLEIIKILK